MINYGCLHRLVGIVITPNYIFNLQGQKIFLFFFFFSSLSKELLHVEFIITKNKKVPGNPPSPTFPTKKKEIKVPSEALSIKREKILRPIQS